MTLEKAIATGKKYKRPCHTRWQYGALKMCPCLTGNRHDMPGFGPCSGLAVSQEGLNTPGFGNLTGVSFGSLNATDWITEDGDETPLYKENENEPWKIPEVSEV